MTYTTASGNVVATKPFSLIGSISDCFNFIVSLISVFFESILSDKDTLKAKGYGRRPGSSTGTSSSTYAERNQRPGGLNKRGPNIKGVKVRLYK